MNKLLTGMIIAASASLAVAAPASADIHVGFKKGPVVAHHGKVYKGKGFHGGFGHKGHGVVAKKKVYTPYGHGVGFGVGVKKQVHAPLGFGVGVGVKKPIGVGVGVGAGHHGDVYHDDGYHAGVKGHHGPVVGVHKSVKVAPGVSFGFGKTFKK